MRLTRAPEPPADDLGAALSARFGNSPDAPPAEDSSGDESSRGVSEGETFLPGANNLVDELRRQVDVLESLKNSSPAPTAPEPVPQAAPLTEMPPAQPVRFGPTTPPPAPAPLDFEALPPINLPDAPIADDILAPPAPATGEVKIKKSREKPAGTKPGRRHGRRTEGTHKADETPELREAAEVEFPEPPAPQSAPAAVTGTVKIKKSSEKPAGKKAGLLGRGRRADGAADDKKAKNEDTPAAPAASVAAPPSEEDGGPRHVGRPLGELLIGRGLVSEDQLRDALTTQTGSGKRLGNILVELGLLTERALVDVLAEQLQLDIVELANLELDRDIVTLLSEEDARNLQAIPIARDGDRIDVAVADPLREHLQDKLIEKLGLPVRLQFATTTDIESVINRMYASAADLGDALRMFEARLEARKTSKESESAVTTVVDENAPVVKVVNLIFDQAVRARASDVHIEPMEEVVRVRARTDGALHEIMTLPGPMAAALVSRIKVMSDMNIVERRKPQDGQLAIRIAGRDLDVRVSTTPTVFGEKCVLRVLDKTKAVIELPGLGMQAETYERYSDLIRSPYGMVICAGPTGSGKTTTLYATLTAINDDNINVVTVEDPVEYIFPKINQIQINEASGLTFANGLRAILRQDPDAILVGEIRDVETARIAVQAALTGHFVMSSLHATDATSALHRFMDMGIEPFLVASSLLGVVGQRLVRKICPHCVQPYDPTPDERAFYERGGGDLDNTEFVFGAGCSVCSETGYYDRIGIYEVLAVTDELKELIVTNAPHAALRKCAMEQGMRTLRDQAIQLVAQRKTTIAEVLRTVYVL